MANYVDCQITLTPLNPKAREVMDKIEVVLNKCTTYSTANISEEVSHQYGPISIIKVFEQFEINLEKLKKRFCCIDCRTSIIACTVTADEITLETEDAWGIHFEWINLLCIILSQGYSLGELFNVSYVEEATAYELYTNREELTNSGKYYLSGYISSDKTNEMYDFLEQINFIQTERYNPFIKILDKQLWDDYVYLTKSSFYDVETDKTYPCTMIYVEQDDYFNNQEELNEICSDMDKNFNIKIETDKQENQIESGSIEFGYSHYNMYDWHSQHYCDYFM